MESLLGAGQCRVTAGSTSVWSHCWELVSVESLLGAGQCRVTAGSWSV